MHQFDIMVILETIYDLIICEISMLFKKIIIFTWPGIFDSHQDSFRKSQRQISMHCNLVY